MRLEPIWSLYDAEKEQWYEASICHQCRTRIDWRKGFYQDPMGRWEFCTECYVHTEHPAGKTLAWWFAMEQSRVLRRNI